MTKFSEKVFKLMSALDDKLSRAFSVWQIFLIGFLAIFLVVAMPSKEKQLEFEKISFLSKQERQYFIPLSERKKRCKSQLECRILAEAIVYEARSESELGQVAVAHVIMNRVNSNRWGDSIKDVVYQYKQFSYTLKRQKNKPSSEDWKNAYLVAYEVINGMIGSPVGNSTHYHTTKVNPKWVKKLEYVATIENHIFYK